MIKKFPKILGPLLGFLFCSHLKAIPCDGTFHGLEGKGDCPISTSCLQEGEEKKVTIKFEKREKNKHLQDEREVSFRIDDNDPHKAFVKAFAALSSAGIVEKRQNVGPAINHFNLCQKVAVNADGKWCMTSSTAVAEIVSMITGRKTVYGLQSSTGSLLHSKETKTCSSCTRSPLFHQAAAFTDIAAKQEEANRKARCGRLSKRVKEQRLEFLRSINEHSGLDGKNGDLYLVLANRLCIDEQVLPLNALNFSNATDIRTKWSKNILLAKTRLERRGVNTALLDKALIPLDEATETDVPAGWFVHMKVSEGGHVGITAEEVSKDQQSVLTIEGNTSAPKKKNIDQIRKRWRAQFGEELSFPEAGTAKEGLFPKIRSKIPHTEIKITGFMDPFVIAQLDL